MWLELIKQITTIILTPLLVYLISKRFDNKIDKRFEGIETDVKKIKHELDADKDTESFIHNAWQFYSYYYETNKDKDSIEIIDAVCNNILNNLTSLLNMDPNKTNIDDIKVILANNNNYFQMVGCNINTNTKDELNIFFNYYYSKIIDIVLDVNNKKQNRIVKETNELIKAIFLTFFKEV